jgi:Cys-tRNA(Pro)/Cys-tRNA(Cys) deacylase
MKNRKTNASRILDSLDIPYELLKYEFDEKQLDAVHVAETIGRPPAQVF